MDKKINNKLSIVLIVIAILVVGYYIYSDKGPVVSAQGFSSIDVKPDKVSVYLSIETKNTTASLARDAHDKISDRVIDDLEDIVGLSEDDIELVYYTIYPEYDWI